MVKDGTLKELTKLRREKKAVEAKGRVKEQADYCNAIGVLLFEAGQLDEALEEHQEELTLCQTVGDSIGEGVAHRRMGEVYCELGRLEEALRHHHRFLEAAERQQDRLEIQRATATVGRTYLLQADNVSSGQEESKNIFLGLANKFFQKSLQILPSVTGVTDRERAEMTARLHLNLGIVAESGGHTEEARAAYNKAAALTAQHDLAAVGRRVHDTVALSLQNTGDYRAALDHLQTSLRLAEKLKDRAARADTLHSRAQVQLLVGDLNAACRTWYKAYKLHSPRASDHGRHARCLRYAVRLSRADEQLLILSQDDHQGRHDQHEEMADWLCRLSAFRPALQHYEAQLDCAEKLGKAESTKAAIYASLAQTHKDLRQYADAKRWFMRELEGRQGNPTEVCKTLMNLASLEASMGGDVGSICEWYRLAAVEAGVSGLPHLRASALRDMADTYHDHGQTEDEERSRRDLALALRADNLQAEEEEDGEDDSSSGAESLDTDILDGLSSEPDEIEQRPRRQAGPLWRNNKGETYLHVACIQGKPKQVERLLRSGHPVNVRDHSGWLPLHEAANFGHSAVMEQLLRHGAHVNDPGGRHCGGVTPLHDAAGNGHLAVARQLLAAGADPAATNEQGQTPLQYLMHYRAEWASDLTAEALADVSLLEQQMKGMLSRRGDPIPDSPSACLSQSPRLRSVKSSSVVDDDSEESQLLPPQPAVSDDEDEPAAAYRRAIRSVGQSAVTTPAAGRRRPSPAATAARSGLVGEAEYQWLEEDVRPALAGRRCRRLSSCFASAGRAEQRSASPLTAGGVRPVSPLWDQEATGPLLPPVVDSPPLVGGDASAGQLPPSSGHRSHSEPEMVAGPQSPIAVVAERRSRKRQRQTRLTPMVPRTVREDGRRPSLSPSPTLPAKQLRGMADTAGPAAACTAGTLRVIVEVERDRLMVPVPMSRPCTVQWLAEQVSDRYYKQFLLRPRLKLLKDGALLELEDTVEVVVRGQDDVLGTRVMSWERPPLPERYSSACSQLGEQPLSAVSARLTAGQSSGRLELADLRLSCDRLRPVLHAVQRYSCITHLLLGGNPLRDTGVQELSATLAHLCGLQTLELTGVQLTAAGLAHLASGVRQQQALPHCTALLLGYNLFADVSAGTHLAALVSLLPRLASLDLTSCQLTERHLAADGDALCRALAGCNLTELRLAYNVVSGGGAELLLRALRPDWLLRLSLAGWRRGVPAALSSYAARGRDCCLQQLDLRLCRVTDQQADQLASVLSACRHLSRLDLTGNSRLSWRGVSMLLEAAVAAGCPLAQLSLAGCGGGGGGRALARLLAGPAPLQYITLSAAAGDDTDPLQALWSRRWPHRAVMRTTPDGDLVLELSVV